MPEICRFYGLVIKMFWADHRPPHFHVEYGEHQAIVAIETLAMIHGSLPPRALGLCVEWAAEHRRELLELWSLAQANQPLHRLDPLT